MADTVDMPSGNPSRKVVGATAVGGAGLIVGNLVEWGLDDYVFQPKVHDSVPGPVTAFVVYIAPIALTFLGGWLTKRSAAEVAPPPPPQVPVAPPQN